MGVNERYPDEQIAEFKRAIALRNIQRSYHFWGRLASWLARGGHEPGWTDTERSEFMKFGLGTSLGQQEHSVLLRWSS